MTRSTRKPPWEQRNPAKHGHTKLSAADKLPPLVGDKGKPTRFALTAAAWGEPVPRNAAAARCQGRRLLARYERTQRRA